MSFGVFPLQYSQPEGVSEELEIVLDLRNPDAPMANLVRIEPVERLNALLVVSKQPQYINQIGRLIGQLTSPTTKNIVLRIKQFAKYDDNAFSCAILYHVQHIGF